jgi:RecB family endonuclease NucS
MRLVIATCSVDYSGRLNAHLPLATRVLMLKQDGSLLVHSDGGSYKPLNWMSPPCFLTVHEPDDDLAAQGVSQVWQVTQAKTSDMLVVAIHEIHGELEHELGEDPGLIKDGVEAHLQRLLAEAHKRLKVILERLGKNGLELGLGQHGHPRISGRIIVAPDCSPAWP